jgi:LysM repeat protein
MSVLEHPDVLPAEAAMPAPLRLAELEERITRLRRRLWIERGCMAAVAAIAAGAWLYPVLLPNAWAVYVDGKPVTAVEDRTAAQALLEQLKQSSGAGASFVQEVRVDRVDPKRVPLVAPPAALEKLRDSVKLRAERAVIYIEGLPVVGLPSKVEAQRVLDQMKAVSAGDAELTGAPTFKQQVEVRTEPAEQELWADADTALALLKGEGGEARSVQVRSGDTGWSIAERADVSLEDLRQANPGVNLNRLRTGQELKLAGGEAEAPLLTAIAEAESTRTLVLPYQTLLHRHPKLYVGKRITKQGGRMGRQRVTYRIRYENGTPVEEKVVSRTVLAQPRPKIVLVGSLPRPGRR